MDLPNINSNQNQNHNQNITPRPVFQPNLLYVSRTGTALVTNITKYLSTLPHPIEVVEELVAVCAVTSSLLTSLHSTLLRFPSLNLSQTRSFIGPLCHDILFAFKQLESRVQEAKRMRVFEPNDVGLVRLPRSAWTLVLGTEAKVAALRSRLYVEKYRVRVLIEAVAWEGLKGLNGRSQREEEELRALRRMLPLVAERLVGVQKDYRPRLMRLNGVVEEPVSEPEVIVRSPPIQQQVAPPTPAIPTPQPKVEVQQKVDFKKPSTGKLSLHCSSSTDSLVSICSTSSSVTVLDDSIHETWLLRCNRPTKNLQTRTRILGLPLLSTHTYSPPTYYVKPVLASASETHNTLKECQSLASPAAHIAALRKTVLKMADDAQWEIQKLVEAREKASSGEKVRRKWEVVGLMERNRRKITPLSADKKWWKRSEKPIVEWVLVLKGETVDHRERVLPAKHEDPWKPKPSTVSPPPPPPPAATVPAAATPQPQVARPMPQQPQGTVLRHVENRRVLSIEEAEVKMREIISDLFVSDPPASDSGSETEVEDSDEEADGEGDEEDGE